MAAPVLPPTMRRRDRLALRLRMWRAGRTGLGERRSALLTAACDAAEGGWVASVVDGPVSRSGTGAMGEAELHLFDGSTLDLGLCHRPTMVALRDALAHGPVVVERLADHRHCWGVYLRTTAGSLGILASRLDVGSGGGGVRVELPLALA